MMYDVPLQAVRAQLETSILDTAHIVFTTLNSAGSNSLAKANPFKVTR